MARYFAAGGFGSREKNDDVDDDDDDDSSSDVNGGGGGGSRAGCGRLNRQEVKEMTSYASKLFTYLLRKSGCGSRRRERREGPAESEGDSPRTLLRAELFSASIHFHRRRNMRAATSPTTPGDGSDGGGSKNRRPLLPKRRTTSKRQGVAIGGFRDA